MPTTLQLPMLELRAATRPETIDDDARTVELTWSTGARVRRYDWLRERAYFEELSLDEGSVRLDRLNSGAPLLDSHASWQLGSVLGRVERAWIDGGVGRALVRFSKRDEVTPIWDDVRDGILTKISVGYVVHAMEDVTGDEDEVRVLRAVDWEPYEVSLVPIPADDGAGVRSRDHQQTYPCAVRGREEMPDQNPPEFGAGVRSDAPSPAPAPAPAPEPARVDTDAIRREAIEAERQRAAAIRQECRRLRLGEELEERLVLSGRSLEDCRADMIDAVASRDQDPPAQPRLDTGLEERAKLRQAVEEALLHRLAPGRYPLTDGARDFRGLSLLELGRDLLQRQGQQTRSMGRMDLAGRALHSTSDFPAILENIANKRLRDAYTASPRTWTSLSRQANLPDFKDVSRVQLGEAPNLELVGEGGEFKRGTVGEGKETWALATYGKVVALTRQAVVNDDLMAFDRVVTAQGNQARYLEDDIVWALITTPHVMADGNNIFHASRNNTVSSNALSSVGNLGKARAKMRKQTGLDGTTILNLRPEYLVVPTDLETVAQQYTRTTMVADSAANINVFAGSLEVIAEPRLDGAATTWYMAASPNQVDIIEWGYLEGEQGPRFFTREGFDVDGVEYKVRLDFGATVLDYRGLVKCTA